MENGPILLERATLVTSVSTTDRVSTNQVHHGSLRFEPASSNCNTVSPPTFSRLLDRDDELVEQTLYIRSFHANNTAAMLSLGTNPT